MILSDFLGWPMSDCFSWVEKKLLLFKPLPVLPGFSQVVWQLYHKNSAVSKLFSKTNWWLSLRNQDYNRKETLLIHDECFDVSCNCHGIGNLKRTIPVPPRLFCWLATVNLKPLITIFQLKIQRIAGRKRFTVNRHCNIWQHRNHAIGSV